MALNVLMWTSAGLMLVATLLYQLHPLFKKHSLKAKILCSSLFVLTGLFAAFAYGAKTEYSVLMLSALVFGLLGDFFLDWKKYNTFFIGVLFFSIGHLIYVYSFITNAPSTNVPTVTNADYLNRYAIHITVIYILVIIAGIAHIKMDKIEFKGKYKVMLLYSLILITSFAFATIRAIDSIKNGNVPFGTMLAISGGLFMISDAFLASQLFGKPKFNKNITEFCVAIFYFPAQTLFALSIYYQ